MKLGDLLYQFKRFFLMPTGKQPGKQKGIDKKIVSHYAQGNVSLYLGRYTTTKDIEERKKLLTRHRF